MALDGHRSISFSNLSSADLYIDALYRGGRAGNASDDPLSKLIGTSNMGGIRYIGSLGERIRLCVLYSTLSDPDWPDTIDLESGRFAFYGDNKHPGHALHDTNKKGNQVLRLAFHAAHTGNREQVPACFVFTKGPEGRDAFFRGGGTWDGHERGPRSCMEG